MKRILMLGLLALSLLCGTAFAKTGEGMTIWFDTGGSVGDGYGTIVQNGAKVCRRYGVRAAFAVFRLEP